MPEVISSHEMQETVARALCENSTQPCNEHSADAGVAVSALVLAGYLPTGDGAVVPGGGSPPSAGAVNTAPSSPNRTAKYVIAAAMSDRSEQLSGEASPLDFDGARMVLAALETHGLTVTLTGGGAGDTPPATSAAPLDPAAQAGRANGTPAPPSPRNSCACLCWQHQAQPCECPCDKHPQSGDGAGAPPAAGGDPAGEATSTPAPSSPHPRRFYLYRHFDHSEVSGTGVVAWGSQWPDKTASLRWAGLHPSTVAWANVERIVAVHGHQGSTELVWLDGDGAG